MSSGTRIDAVFVDTNCLVLLIVGYVDPERLGRGRLTSNFTRDHFFQLSAFLEKQTIMVTPHILAETSNLLDKNDRCMARLRGLVTTVEERWVDGKTVVGQPHFFHVGVTDAALLELATETKPVLTADKRLWLLAMRKVKRAILFPDDLL